MKLANKVRLIVMMEGARELSSNEKQKLIDKIIDSEISNMVKTVRDAEVATGLSREGDDMSTVTGRWYSNTFPKWYRNVGAKNKDELEKIAKSRNGIRYKRLVEIARDRLINGYEDPESRDYPDNDFRELVGMRPFDEKLNKISENLPKGAVEIGNGAHVMFYAMITEILYNDGKVLVKMNQSFRKKEDQAVFTKIAIKHFSPFDFNQERSALLADGKVDKAFKALKEELEKELTSELEKWGLGKAPFKFIGAMDSPSQAVQDSNPEGYNNALRQFPRFDAGGIGSCARCYNAITTHYIIKSSDGKIFPLGSECVGRLNDKKVESEAKKASLKINKEKNDKRNDLKKDELESILSNPVHIKSLKNMPRDKPMGYDKWDDNKKSWWEGKMGHETMYDQLTNTGPYSNNTTSGKLRKLKAVKQLLGIK